MCPKACPSDDVGMSDHGRISESVRCPKAITPTSWLLDRSCFCGNLMLSLPVVRGPAPRSERGTLVRPRWFSLEKRRWLRACQRRALAAAVRARLSVSLSFHVRVHFFREERVMARARARDKMGGGAGKG